MKTREAVINEVTEAWAKEFIQDVAQAAATKVKKDTGEGAASFDVDVLKATSATAAVVITNFADHMRLFDMRKVERQSDLTPEGLERIKKWVERKGISNFLKGYQYPTQVRRGGNIVDVSTTRIINNIAWGISKKRKKLKRQQWYNKQKGSDIYQLYAKLVDAVVEHSLNDINYQLVISN